MPQTLQTSRGKGHLTQTQARLRHAAIQTYNTQAQATWHSGHGTHTQRSRAAQHRQRDRQTHNDWSTQMPQSAAQIRWRHREAQTNSSRHSSVQTHAQCIQDTQRRHTPLHHSKTKAFHESATQAQGHSTAHSHSIYKALKGTAQRAEGTGTTQGTAQTNHAELELPDWVHQALGFVPRA